VFTRIDRRLEMDWPKMRRRGEEDKIDIAVDELLIRIETDVTAIIVDLNLITIGVIVGTEHVSTTVESIAKDIGKRDEADLIARFEDIERCPGSAAAATEHAGFELIGPGAVG